MSTEVNRLLPSGAQSGTPERVGRYVIFDELAEGGMATVHLARLRGPEGFSRVVAVKRLLRPLFDDLEFRQMFLKEARLAARVRHPNVVPILDVLVHQDELILVMDYVHGESLAALVSATRDQNVHIPLSVATAVMVSVLHGLHSAHEATNERGEPLGIVHRDVSPQNVLVGVDGVARVLDFGVAKAIESRGEHLTEPGTVKGKISYMAPEVILGRPITRQADVFSAATVLWELLAGRKLFPGATDEARLLAVLEGRYPSPREFAPRIPPEVEAIVMKGLKENLCSRYSTAQEMAVDLERYSVLASQGFVGDWVSRLAAESLAHREELLHRMEASALISVRAPELTADDGSMRAPRSTLATPALPRPCTSTSATTVIAVAHRPLRLGWFLGAVSVVALASAGIMLWPRQPQSDARTAHAATSRVQLRLPLPTGQPLPATAKRADVPHDGSRSPGSSPPPLPTTLTLEPVPLESLPIATAAEESADEHSTAQAHARPLPSVKRLPAAPQSARASPAPKGYLPNEL